MKRPFVEQERGLVVQSVQSEDFDCEWQSFCRCCACRPLAKVGLGLGIFCSRTQFFGLDPAFACYGEEGADRDFDREGEGLVG